MRDAATTILALFVLGTGLCGQTNGPFEKLAFDAALNKAKTESKVVFIDFFTTWCGPCKKLDSTLRSGDRLCVGGCNLLS